MATLLGGEFDGEKITLSIREDMKAYQSFFPLFRLNVLNWKNTRAYHNGKKVDPYRFMFLMEQKRNRFFAEALEQLDNGHLLDYQSPYLYHKREGSRFYFRGTNESFHLDFKGKTLYDFVDKFDIGDIVYFE